MMQSINDTKAVPNENEVLTERALSFRIQEHALIFEFNLYLYSPKQPFFTLMRRDMACESFRSYM